MARRGQEPMRLQAEAALDRLKDSFRELDEAQRETRAVVDSYRLHLPERSRTTGLMPRYLAINGEADRLVGIYLQLLDQYPLTPVTPLPLADRAGREYFALEPALRRAAADLRQFLADYDNELARIGVEVGRLGRLRADAVAAVARATDAWIALRDAGLGSDGIDTTLAQARVEARGLEEWEIGRGAADLETRAARVTTLAEQVVVSAAGRPEQVRKLQNRARTLPTVIESIQTRQAAMAQDLGTLRREYALGNWRDIEKVADDVSVVLGRLGTSVASFTTLVGAARWDEARTVLDAIEVDVDEVDELVDAPRDRISRLRSFAADPSVETGRARFALHDAQLLVTARPGPHQRAHAAELDRLAARLQTMPARSDQPHPDYWAALKELDHLVTEVRRVVAEVRAGR